MSGVYMPKGYCYIGPQERISPCQYNLNEDGHEVCSDGRCPGKIDGQCRFGDDYVDDEFADLFGPRIIHEARQLVRKCAR